MDLDVEIHHLETAHPLEFSNVVVVSQGPLRAAVRAEVKYGQSTISVTVRTFLERLSEFRSNFIQLPRSLLMLPQVWLLFYEPYLVARLMNRFRILF